jgi:hypothetical protein
MAGIHIIKGKPVLSATLIACAVKRKGSPYSFEVAEHTDKVCEIIFSEHGKEIGRSRFSVEDAKQAGLLEGSNAHSWKKFPRNMLYARAMSNGAKWYCPDIFGGAVFYTPDELDQKVDAEGDIIIEAEKPKPPTKNELVSAAKKQSGESSALDEGGVKANTLAFIRAEISELLKLVNINPTKTLTKLAAAPDKAELALFAVRKDVITRVLVNDNGWDDNSLQTYFTPFGFQVLAEANLEQLGAVIKDLRDNKML